MKINILAGALALACAGCTPAHPSESQAPKNNALGTWQLVAKTTYIGDTVKHDKIEGTRTIKIINDTHFAFLTHEAPIPGDTTKVPAVFVAGGGTYTLRDSLYTERLEYCNFRAWENHEFNFTLKVKGDSLIQSGEEKVEAANISQTIVEKYLRVKP
jgi:hypothetical protein